MNIEAEITEIKGTLNLILEKLSGASVKERMNAEELAAYLGWTKGYIYDLVQEKTIPCHRFPKPTSHPTFYKDEIDAWIAQKKVEARKQFRRAA